MARRESKSGGARKYGRNIAKCADYQARGTRESNKARRIARDALRAS